MSIKADWVTRFKSMAEEVSTWSKDPDCQVGAVIVSPDARLMTMGYNGYPSGAVDNYDVVKDIKLQRTVHAELNAILNARRDLTGWILFCTKPPCAQCAAAIIQAGIARVWCPKPDEKSSWSESNVAAINLLTEANVVASFYSDSI